MKLFEITETDNQVMLRVQQELLDAGFEEADIVTAAAAYKGRSHLA